jgi:hypothetical protein
MLVVISGRWGFCADRFLVVTNARCGFRADCWRCILMKIGSIKRELYDLPKHLIRIIDFTGRGERTLTISSFGRKLREWDGVKFIFTTNVGFVLSLFPARCLPPLCFLLGHDLCVWFNYELWKQQKISCLYILISQMKYNSFLKDIYYGQK